jgi:RNA polymerase sigma-70 factor (ECF subfamily)
MPSKRSDDAKIANQYDFATTQWTIVLAAGRGEKQEAQAALAQLCEIYWYPIYSYVRRRTKSADEAQDRTQAFFTHLLEKGIVLRADRRCGRFRAYLLTAAKNFLAGEWQWEQAHKRGGGRLRLSLDFDAGESKFQLEPAHELTPEKLFERRWVITLLNRVLDRLEAELADAGKQLHFEHLKVGLTGEAEAADFQRAAKALGMTPAASKQAAYRLRKRYRQIFREEVRRTVADESEVDEEIKRLLAILGE